MASRQEYRLIFNDTGSEPYYAIGLLRYDSAGNLYSVDTVTICSNSISGVREEVNALDNALDKPILDLNSLISTLEKQPQV
jgi:hypothetical protein